MPMSPRLLRPRQGGDPDALRYIAAVQQADGATLEPAVRKAINDFVIGCKADGIWSAIQNACILAGARTLTGALVPLVGPAPTNNNFGSGDYDRMAGLKGSGSSKDLLLGLSNSALPQNSNHYSANVHTPGTLLDRAIIAATSGTGRSHIIDGGGTSRIVFARNMSGTSSITSLSANQAGFFALARPGSATYVVRAGASTQTFSVASVVPDPIALHVFSAGTSVAYDGRINWFSVGSHADMGLLRSRVQSLLGAIGAALAPNYADPDVNAYITAVELADGGLMLEPGVRDAINDFIIGCKADGIWSAIKASCILAGARTLAGALTPLVGAAPTNNGGFVASDYDRRTGLVGNGTTKYLDTGRAGNADPQDSSHMAVYLHSLHTVSAAGVYIGHGGIGAGATNLLRNASLGQHGTRSRSANPASVANAATGLFGVTRSGSASYTARTGGTDYPITQASASPSSDSVFVFTRNNGSGGVSGVTNARMSFYSIGENLSLSLLEGRLATYLTAIGAAIP